MADEQNPLDLEKDEDEGLPSEMDVLKQRAKVLGVTHSNNISLEKLREKVTAALEGNAGNDENEETADAESDTAAPNPLAGDTGSAPVKKKTLRQHLIEENMKLIRVRITNLDPKKKDLQGEIFTVANEYLGTIRKFVPFGEATDEGYHIPKCIYDLMADRKFLNIRTLKDRRTGVNRVESNYVREFALEVLPDLTEKELKELAASQAASGSLKE
uniref:N4 protein n=1 Tax=Pseudomonas phage Arace01 TaxID=3138526 RepID=A0AAU6VZK7_9VIRU